MKPPHGRLTVDYAAREPAYHWLCIVCCDYAEDPDGMPTGWQWIPPGIPMCGECLADIEQREKGAKP